MPFNVTPATPSPARSRDNEVRWFIPNRKRPIAKSTRAVNDWIVQLSKDGCTIGELYRRLTEDYIPDPDAVKIIAEYIKRGYGDEIARQWFKENLFEVVEDKFGKPHVFCVN